MLVKTLSAITCGSEVEIEQKQGGKGRGRERWSASSGANARPNSTAPAAVTGQTGPNCDANSGLSCGQVRLTGNRIEAGI
jgi:hypothetical protein